MTDRLPVDPDELREDLATALGAPVETRETHISWVFLAGERAYKLKKPIVLPFVDYGTAERRRTMCEEEVRLNRRLAPDVYLGVRGVVPDAEGLRLGEADDPAAIDYVVEMRRYDESGTLAATLARGESPDAALATLGGRLARFHADASRVEGGGASAAEQEVAENLVELLPQVSDPAVRDRIGAIARFLHSLIAARRQVLEDRSRGGLVREGHGDLRAEHVVLGPPLAVVDCVEFDPALRRLDVADDLAFLLSDLTAAGADASPLLAAYRAAGGDPGPDWLVAMYAIHRSLIRTKVLEIAAAQRSGERARRARAEADARLEVAERLVWRARAPLAIVVCGTPASGKSTLAGALAATSEWPVLASDETRKQLAGIAPTQRASAVRYSESFSRVTYAELGRRAAETVAGAGTAGGVIVDATFRRRGDRAAFAGAFGSAAPLVFVQCVAPAGVLLERARARELEPGHVSDATAAVVAREWTSWDPLDEVPAGRHLILRSDRPLTALLSELIGLLDGRLWASGGSRTPIASSA